MYKLFLLGIILGMCQCNSIRPKNNPPLSTPTITFGRGGGFTGMIKSYTLYENGNLYLDNSADNPGEALMLINRNQSEQLFHIYNQMNFKDLNIQLPGNYYKFVQYNGDNYKHKIIWSKDDDVPKEVVIFFKMLNKLVQE